MHTYWFGWVAGTPFLLFHPSSTSMSFQSPSQGIHGISEVLDGLSAGRDVILDVVGRGEQSSVACVL
jgi:hypothetical protein